MRKVEHLLLNRDAERKTIHPPISVQQAGIYRVMTQHRKRSTIHFENRCNFRTRNNILQLFDVIYGPFSTCNADNSDLAPDNARFARGQ
jgi:hypothetical protein